MAVKPQPPEVLPAPDRLEGAIDITPEVLDRAGNHVAKLATILALTTFPRDANVRSGELTKRLNELQGSNPGIVFDQSNLPFSFCKTSFAPIGLVTLGSEIGPSGRRTGTARLTERGLTTGVTVAGALLQLVLDNGGLPLYEICGQKSQGEDALPLRLALFAVLLRQGTTSLFGLVEATGRDITGLQRAIGKLSSIGILQEISKFDRASRKFAISEPSQEGITIMRAIAQLRSEDRTEVTGKDILRAALALEPAMSQKALWHTLLNWARKPERYRPSTFIKELPLPIEEGQRTAIRITDAYQGPIEELLRVRAILMQNSQEALGLQAAAGRHAQKIVASPHLMARLLATMKSPARANSKGSAAWALAIERHLRPEGIAVPELHQAVRETTGEDIGYELFRRYIRRLKHVGVGWRGQIPDSNKKAAQYAFLRPFPGDWQEAAHCETQNIDPELFFPIGTTGLAVAQAEEAKQVCQACPVRMPCLRQAVVEEDRHGIRGGVWLEHPKEKLSKSRRQEIVRMVRLVE